MLAPQDEIESLAERIERAYSLRRPHWYHGCSTPRVWATAASVLLAAHGRDPRLPIDPELYVSAQLEGSGYADPWAELTRPTSARRYRIRVQQIVRGLRAELRSEVLRAESRLRQGTPIEQLVLSRKRSLSPLGRFIVAHRAGRDDLLKRLRDGAVDQHRACPLYRQAALCLIPPEAYPVREEAAPAGNNLRLRRIRPQAPWN